MEALDRFDNGSFWFGVPRLRGRLKAELQTFRKEAYFRRFTCIDNPRDYEMLRVLF